jgi:hypothetical protein
LLRLGSLVLSSVLLGVPRALEGLSFGRPPSVYVGVETSAADLEALTEELDRALAQACLSRASRRREATTVVELEPLGSKVEGRGRGSRAVAVTVRREGRPRRLVLSFTPGHAAAAARRLLACLEPPGRNDS